MPKKSKPYTGENDGGIPLSVTVKFIKSLRADIRRLRFQKIDFSSFDRKKLIWPFYLLKHPFAGISDIKYEGCGSAKVAAVILFLYFVSNVLRFFNTGFIFNMNDTDNFNIVMELLSSVILVVLWTVSNWSVSTLMDGEGKFRDIWIVSCYAVLPKFICNMLFVILSNFMIFNESVFLNITDVLGTIWTAFLMVVGILIIHQYSLMKTIACCLATVFGIAAILFITILFISIIQQVIGFVDTVSVEILNRY